MVMKEQMQIVDTLISTGEFKKAEIAVARLLRSDLPTEQQTEALLHRARIRILSGRPEDTLEDLQTISQISPEDYASPQVMELRGDAYFARFELASVGFAQ